MKGYGWSLKFDPSQPRVPAGSSEGGRWTSFEGIGNALGKLNKLKPDPTDSEFVEVPLTFDPDSVQALSGRSGWTQREMVSIDDVVTTEPYVHKEGVARYLKDPASIKDEPIILIEWEGKYVVQDGMHRLSALKLLGETEVDADIAVFTGRYTAGTF